MKKPAGKQQRKWKFFTVAFKDFVEVADDVNKLQAVIPNSWFMPEKMMSMWPPQGTNVGNYALKQIVPKDGWTLHCVENILGQAGKKIKIIAIFAINFQYLLNVFIYYSLLHVYCTLWWFLAQNFLQLDHFL